MKSSLKLTVIERAQPLLGTFVSIRVEGVKVNQANKAINAAFTEIGLIHRLMCFHNSDSDISRLNNYAFQEPVKVHRHTLKVLKRALEISSVSGGCFDITVASNLVDWKFLPSPSKIQCNPKASWRDIEFLNDGKVVFLRSLWIDVGGIAKGYAVDRAARTLQKMGVEQYVVNAGGDIRVGGKTPEKIVLDTGIPMRELPLIELKNGSIASSSGWRNKKKIDGSLVGPHVQGISRTAVSPEHFATVIAKTCTIADALTKVVLAQGVDSKQILKFYGAEAYFYNTKSGWTNIMSNN